MGNEAKWNANLKKVAYLKTFPGWLSSWKQCVGSTIEQVISIPEQDAHAVLLLSQGKFIVTPQSPYRTPNGHGGSFSSPSTARINTC